MNRERIRKISLIGLLVLAVAAFAYFGLVRRPAREPATRQTVAAKDVYYCPMHKNYHSDKPGNCPICGMKLVKLEKGQAATKGSGATPAPASPQTSDQGIFVPPEKQQLIGMHS